MNILVLSCGTRNKVLQFFKENMTENDGLYATDCSELAPALYEADKYFIVPPMTEQSYLDTILDICRDNEIDAVFSLIDPELSLISRNMQKFIDIGTIPVVSDYDVVEMCFDKIKTMEKLKELGLNVIKSYTEKEEFYADLEKGEISFPVFVKPVHGSASININKVYSKEAVEVLFSLSKDMMIQKYMGGTEYGADVYVDMVSGETISIFIKEKLKMRAGETDKSVSVRDDELTKLILDFTKKVHFRGMIDIDVFKVDGKYYISEINPRFGGGYPHAYKCGVNEPKMVINNIMGKANKSVIGEYKAGIYMMKYMEVIIK